MVGMSLPVDGSCDHELKVKGFSNLEIGDWTQDYSADNAVSTTISQGPSLWENSDPGDALQLLQSEEDCAALEFTLRGED